MMKVQRSLLVLGFGVLCSDALAQVPADPTISVTGQSTAQQTVSVTVTESTSGATLVYTTNGSIPTPSSPAITSGSTILIPQNATLKVQAFLNGATNASSLISEKFAVAGMVSAGMAHTLILKNDGTVWASGDNSAGELGNGGTTPASTPVQVKTNSSTNLTNIVAVAAANDESFAVDASGNVWAWGLNTNSQLGIGTSSNALYATQISTNTLSNMIGIAASGNHAVALRTDGSVWGWGANASGQVGNGATSAWVTTPTQVLAPSGQSGNLAGIVAVAAGTNHSLALTSGGNVYAWGSDSAGQLGDADTSLTSQSLPVVVQKSGVALTNVVALAGGAINSFALRNDGSVVSWGDNTVGELGNGTTSPATPVNPTNLSAAPVTGLSGTMVAVSSQSAYGSNAYTWGDNTYGELGIGLTGSYATVPLIVNLTGATPPTLTINTGNNQSVGNGSFTTPLTVTATISGTPVQNALVDFIVTQGGGLLATSTTSPQLSGIVQVLTNSSGQTASVYYQDPSNGQVTSQIGATNGNGTIQDAFTILTSMAVSADTPTMPQWALILMAMLLFYSATRRKRLIRLING
jgi:alpha-tubulin suppressor-like RCC1 family protein